MDYKVLNIILDRNIDKNELICILTKYGNYIYRTKHYRKNESLLRLKIYTNKNHYNVNINAIDCNIFYDDNYDGYYDDEIINPFSIKYINYLPKHKCTD